MKDRAALFRNYSGQRVSLRVTTENREGGQANSPKNHHDCDPVSYRPPSDKTIKFYLRLLWR